MKVKALSAWDETLLLTRAALDKIHWSSARWPASPTWSGHRRCWSGAPLLAEALGYVGHPPIRNSGTVGGSLAHADPAAELPAVALALDAELVAAGPGGTRRVPAAEFFTGPFSTALEPGEILTEVRFPRRAGGHAFVEFARTHGNFALVGVAAVVELDGGRWPGRPSPLSGVAGTPVRADGGRAGPARHGRGRRRGRRGGRGAVSPGCPRPVTCTAAPRPGSTSRAATCAAASRWRAPAPRTGGERHGDHADRERPAVDASRSSRASCWSTCCATTSA